MAADKTFFGRLKNIFSGGTVVTRTSSGLKVLDINKVQANSDLATNRLVDRYNRLHTSNTYTTYNSAVNFHTARLALFTDYELMDEDSIISSALNIYADECTLKNEYGDILDITSHKSDIKDILHNLFYDIMNIEYNLWPWIRNLCKYGDFFLKLDISEGVGITNIIPISAYEMQREEGVDPANPEAVRFIADPASPATTYGSTISTHDNKTIFDNYEIAHFRLLSDTNFLPYGKSMLEGARKTWKQLTLMEDAMLIHRIMRAPEKRVFKIDIGNIPPNEVDAYMQRVMMNMKKTPYVDPNTGEYNLKFNMSNMLEDFYLPVRGGQAGTEIDTLSGMEFGGIDDIEYLKNRMLAALQIPKAFIGYEEGVEGKATLAAQDVRFCRTIERIQKIVVSELYKIALVHLYSQGYKGEDLLDFKLSLTTASKIYEQEQLELWDSKISLADSMLQSQLISQEFIYKNIFNLSDEQILEEKANVVQDTKRKFRLEQIEQEGNDPVKTNDVLGTPHAIAMVDLEAKGSAGGGEAPTNESEKTVMGDKARKKKYGHQDSARGRDPLGREKSKRDYSNPDRKTHENFIKSLEALDTSNILSENGLLNDE